MKPAIAIAYFCALILLFTAGCGGGDHGGGSQTRNFAVTLLWPDRRTSSSASDPIGAQSASLTLKGGNVNGSDATITIDRKQDAAYSETASFSNVKQAATELDIVYFGGRDGQAPSVATAELPVPAASLPVPRVKPAGVVTSVVIAPGQSVAVGGTPRQLVFTAFDTANNVVGISTAVQPGWTIVSGAGNLEIVNGLAEGLASGSAQVTVSILQVTSAPTSIAVTGSSMIIAEAGAQSGAPIVRIHISDTLFGLAGVQQFKLFRLPDFPFSSSGGGRGRAAAAIPVSTAAPSQQEIIDLPSPYFFYKNGAGFLVSDNNAASSGTSNGNHVCTVVTPDNPAALDVGFHGGTSYRYQLTAIVQRQSNVSGGGATGGNTGSGGVDCIETDPVQSGLCTPLAPVTLLFPGNQSGAIEATSFSPVFGSRAGADVFQVEISTDRSFKDPKRIFKLQLISTAPNRDDIIQVTPSPIDLTTQSELLSDPIFAGFLTAPADSNPQVPTIFWRVGARHDEDVPGPIHDISQKASDTDRTFRYVYSQVFSFTPAPIPPIPPGRQTAVQGKSYQRMGAGRR